MTTNVTDYSIDSGASLRRASGRLAVHLHAEKARNANWLALSWRQHNTGIAACWERRRDEHMTNARDAQRRAKEV